MGYWLELAYDPGFQRMTMSRWGLKDTRFDTGDLAVGTYYWRIVALDKFGLPGERGDAWRFHVRVDKTPPFLTIEEPAEDETITKLPLRVRGETEPGASMLLDGDKVSVDAEGGFSAELQPPPGPAS